MVARVAVTVMTRAEALAEAQRLLLCARTASSGLDGYVAQARAYIDMASAMGPETLEVVTLLRSLHRPIIWRLSSSERKGCATGGGGRNFATISWPCETAALLDSIEATLSQE